MLVRVAISVCVLLALALCPSALRANQAVVVDFGKKFDIGAVELKGAKVSLQDDVLRVDAGHKDKTPGIVLKAPEGRWNLSLFHELAVHVRNVGKNNVTLGCRAENADSDGVKHHCSTGTVTLTPGQRSVIRVTLTQALPPELRSHLIAMRGVPLGMSADIDSSKVTRMVIFAVDPTEDSSVELSSPLVWNLTEPNQPINERELFPMIDAFGQFMHKDWPGKTHSLEDLAAAKKAEEADLAANPGSKDRDQYGGWKDGPQLKATGFFRAEKHQGKWWLVDPEGRLFWSQGITCVGWGEGRTPITDRKHWFVDLPAAGSPFAQFYGSGSSGLNYYKDKTYESFDFLCANLLRKYGEGWQDAYAQLAHRRLHSWGMNTIAMWSASEICRLHKTPYVAASGLGGRSIEGSQGYWGKFVDVFDPSFLESASKLTVDEKLVNDPWCIGFFMDNELCWGDELSLAIATLRSPADQPAKKEFLEDLKKKYGTVEKLNTAWGAAYASWDAMLESKAMPNEKKAKADLLAFDTRLCNRYFEVCSGAIKRAAPNHMYLGCRFSRSNEPAVRAAARYCDVVSFNRYQYTLADMRLPEGLDKPVMIGEFHFGALDRGMFSTGLCPTADQEDRADRYKAYVRSALDNACVVGAHYFEYTDQPTTGRGDCENYQIGFLDTCDAPYPEIIQAAREIGSELYQRRSKP